MLSHENSSKASLTIRNLDPALKQRLRVQAARHGHSMEAEARRILSEGIGGEVNTAPNLAEAIRRRFAALGGVELELPLRTPPREPPTFD